MANGRLFRRGRYSRIMQVFYDTFHQLSNHELIGFELPYNVSRVRYGPFTQLAAWEVKTASSELSYLPSTQDNLYIISLGMYLSC